MNDEYRVAEPVPPVGPPDKIGGMAIAGIILGILSILLGCLALIWAFVFNGTAVLQQMGH